MINEDTLAVVTKLAIIAAILFVAGRGVIWMATKYFEFLAWAGNL